MAFVQGFAESHTDLLDKLKIYATSTVSSGDQWAIERYVTGDELILSGQGYSTTDTIYIGFKVYSDLVNDNFALILNGFTGFNNLLGFYEQPGGLTLPELPSSLPLLKSIPTNANAIKYWFFVDAAHIKVVARTGTVFHQCYMGFYLPYGTPVTYSYPLIFSGSGLLNSASVPPKNSDVTNATHSFWKPIDAYNTSPINLHVGNLCIKEPGGSNLRIVTTTHSGQSNSSQMSGVYPYSETLRGYLGGFENLRPNLDGTYPLNDIQIISGVPPNILGTFIGMKHTTGTGLTAEDVVTDENSDDWLVVTNTFRSSDTDVALYRLA